MISTFLVGARWLPMTALVAIALSVAIETTQALVRGIGRACDTGDLLTNATGALLGSVLAAVALRLAHRGEGTTAGESRSASS